jgi:hypothetical protein
MIPNRLIEYGLAFPLSFFSKNWFIIKPTGENSCVFTAKGFMRSGPLFKNSIKNVSRLPGNTRKKRART